MAATIWRVVLKKNMLQNKRVMGWACASVSNSFGQEECFPGMGKAWSAAAAVVVSKVILARYPRCAHACRTRSIHSPDSDSTPAKFSLNPPLCVTPATVQVRSMLDGSVCPLMSLATAAACFFAAVLACADASSNRLGGDDLLELDLLGRVDITRTIKAVCVVQCKPCPL